VCCGVEQIKTQKMGNSLTHLPPSFPPPQPQLQSLFNNPFDSLPIELTQLILRLTGEWAGIAAHTCKTWRAIICHQHSDRPPKLFLECVVESISLIQWACQNGCKWDASLCNGAAKKGNLEVLNYLHENGCPWDTWTCASATLGGHLHVLKYLHENGCPWNKWSCAYAAQEGHLEVLKYLHVNGCPWHEETCARAAGRRRIEILKWIHENGCPCYELTHKKAEKGDYGEEVKEWAKQYHQHNSKE
jgi:hypothetical protein